MTIDSELNTELISELVENLIKEKNVPGVAVGILYKSQTYAAGFGVTSLENPLPVTDETLFQIGSITKTYTGTAIMKLVEMGKLYLDATVRTYIPDFKVSDETASSQATLRHLLTHTCGWDGDVFDDTGLGDDALGKYVNNMAELKQLAPLGSQYSYCNSALSVAGLIIEVVTGKSYEAVIKELIFDPLGLERSFFDPGELMTYRFVAGHSVTSEGIGVARPWSLARSLYPAGGITCHVKDLLRYARFHLGDGKADDGTRLLSPESIELMKSTQMKIWGTRSNGLPWMINEIDGVRVISHSGGTKGQVSLLVLAPEHDFALAILTNAGHGDIVTQEVRRWAFKQYLDLEIPEPKPIESSMEELASFVGHYSQPFMDIDLHMLEGKLTGLITEKKGFPTKDSPPDPPTPLKSIELCEEDCLLITDGPANGMLCEIFRKADGSIGWLRFALRLHEREA